jgi:transketolase
MARYGVLRRQGPVYTSLNSGKFPVITPESYVFKPGVPVQFTEGKDITIVALGSAVHDALKAAEELKGTFSCEIFAMTSIRPFFPETIIDSMRKTGLVLTVEQHSTHGGAGSLAAELIAENGLSARLKRLGIPEGSFTKNRTAADNKAYFKLDSAGIKETLSAMRARG